MSISKYQIMKTIDAPLRLLGLTLDEAIPAILCVVVLGFLLGQMVIGIIATALVLVGMRLLKRGKSGGFLLNAIYWKLPGVVFGSYLKRTPPGSDRHFIA